VSHRSTKPPSGLAPLAVRSSNRQPERVSPTDAQSVLATVRAEQERTARQVESLERVVASIVEASELTSTDDEHDPEGATIAYERAQAIALLRQAREDLDALVVTRMQLESAQVVLCSVCGRPIDLERVATLPTTSRCIRCAA
jgi:DnaK suppressor protein